MREKLTILDQYGFETDVFDKYRESVRRSNQDAVKVFSILVIASALLISVYGFVTNQAKEGAIFCALSLAAGISGAVISFRKKPNRAVPQSKHRSIPDPQKKSPRPPKRRKAASGRFWRWPRR